MSSAAPRVRVDLRLLSHLQPVLTLIEPIGLLRLRAALVGIHSQSITPGHRVAPKKALSHAHEKITAPFANFARCLIGAKGTGCFDGHYLGEWNVVGGPHVVLKGVRKLRSEL